MNRLSFLSFILLAAMALHAQVNVVPRPQTITLDARQRTLSLASLEGIVTSADVDMMRNAQFLSDYTRLPVNNQLGKKAVALRLQINPKMTADEGYSITTSEHGITIEGRTPAGVFYGIQIVRQLWPGAQTLPLGTIASQPRFSYRGMHLDVVRHFFNKDVVKRYLDMMALHGMNRLHWHLTDDQGWRIEIKKWPRLTQIGSMRDRTVIGRNMGIYDHTPHGGYFTQQDIREIVRYAQDRYITIIPEVDMPGHMVAALTAYPELGCTGGPYEVWPIWGVSDDILCGGNPRVYDFLKDVFTEVMDLFPSEYIHVGGDEVPKTRWQTCPRCQQKIADEHLQASDSHTAEDRLQGYITRQMEQFLAERGRHLMGWDELADCDVNTSSLIMNWRDWKGVTDPVTQGFHVVRTPNSTLYFDHYQIPQDSWSNTLLFGGNAPLEKVYAYEPAPASLTAEEQARVVGVQANLWTEYIAYPELIEYQVLPRMAALAEVQWLSPEKKDYDDFLSRLPRLFERYDAEGWQYCKAALQKNK